MMPYGVVMSAKDNFDMISLGLDSTGGNLMQNLGLESRPEETSQRAEPCPDDCPGPTG
jgi:hypothetical protein